MNGNDWRNTYNNKLQLLEYLNSKQSGGAVLNTNPKPTVAAAAPKPTVSAKPVSEVIRRNIPVKGIKGKGLLSVLTTIFTILLIFVSYLIVYGSYKKYVQKSSDYQHLGPFSLLKKSFEDFFKNISYLFGLVVGVFGIRGQSESTPIGPASEVFNLGNNHYTFDEAKQACSILGARLATRAEVEGAYNKGAEWCNYGWSAGGEALYPTQKKTHELLKRAGRDGECGIPGVNGGHFEDKNMKLGANCYGVKPSPDNDNIIRANCSDPTVTQLLDITNGQYGIKYECVSGSATADLSMSGVLGNLMPHNNYTWSKGSRKSNLYVGNNTLSRNGLRYEGFEGGPKHGDIDENNLKNAMTDILVYLGGSSYDGSVMTEERLTEDLKGVLTPKKDRAGRDMWNRKEDEGKIVEVALNKMMSIYKSYGIPVDNRKIDYAIDNASMHRNTIHKLKRDIDYKLTRASINGIYQLYKVNYGKK